MFIDGSVHVLPMAEVYLDTPFYQGHVTAVVIKNPLYPLIVGNIAGVDDKSLVCLKADSISQQESVSSVPNSPIQRKICRESKSKGAPLTPCKVFHEQKFDVNRSNLFELQ